MHRTVRPVVYVVACAILLIASLAAPGAWATPGQSFAAQTVPTATPPAPPDEPPDEPEPPTGVPPSETPQPAVTGQPATAAAPGPCPSNSKLTLAADRRAVWQGATVVFTATLANTGQQPLRGITLQSELPADLEPLSVISGNASWQDRTLRVTSDSLAPTTQLAVVYSIRVAAGPAGRGIVVRASATSAGCKAQTASVTLGPPPSELPQTGGSIR